MAFLCSMGLRHEIPRLGAPEKIEDEVNSVPKETCKLKCITVLCCKKVKKNIHYMSGVPELFLVKRKPGEPAPFCRE